MSAADVLQVPRPVSRIAERADALSKALADDHFAGLASFDLDTSNPYFAKAVELRKAFARDAAERDRAGGRPLEQVRLLKESGLLKLQIPKEFGGEGQNWAAVYKIVREFAKVDGSLAHLLAYHFQSLNKVYTQGNPEQQAYWYRETAKRNLFWGNVGNSTRRTLIGRRVDNHYILNGHKHFSSGSHVADYVSISWDPDDGKGGLEDRLHAAIPTSREGVKTLDDWDGLGQRQTGSGTVVFENVRVDDEELRDVDYAQGRPYATLIPSLAKSALIGVFVGSAEGALIETRDYVHEFGKPWLTSGVKRAVDDPWVKRLFGELYILTQSAALMADNALESLDATWWEGETLNAEDRGRNAVVIAAANVHAGNVALDVTSRIYELAGPRAATRSLGLDRFWRNVRTHTLHNPAEYKARNVGYWFATGDYPEPGGYQ
jgi:alkylation response protein AidB-like acyl-CoA dehydrogenase